MPRESQRINVAAALIIGADFAMMLTALTLVLPPTSYAWPVLAPHVAAALFDPNRELQWDFANRRFKNSSAANARLTLPRQQGW